MTAQELIKIGLKKTGAYLDYPFGPDVTVLKVENRIFLQVFLLKGALTTTMNCTAEIGQLYRSMFPEIVVRGYHCPPVQQPYFNTMPLDGAVPDEMLVEMLEHSYRTAVTKLPKYVQKRLAEEGGVSGQPKQ